MCIGAKIKKYIRVIVFDVTWLQTLFGVDQNEFKQVVIHLIWCPGTPDNTSHKTMTFNIVI